MQGGIHLLTGLVLASFSKRKEYKLGAVFGSIIPDIDILVAGIGYLLIKDEEQALNLHRSFTHSIFIIPLISLLIVGLGLIPYIKNRTNYDFVGLGIGLAFGMLLHTLLDTLYLVGVAIFWPFSNQYFGIPVVPVEVLSDVAVKLLHTTDFLTDIFLFIIPMLYLSFKVEFNQRVRVAYIIYIILNIVAIIFFIFLCFNNSLTIEEHVVYLYYPGTFFLLVSVFSPIIFRDIVRDFEFSIPNIVIICSLFLLSQFLFGLVRI